MAVVRIGMADLQELNAMLRSLEVDKLVQAVDTRLQQAVGKVGTLGRLTEAEFALLLPRLNLDGARGAAHRVQPGAA